MKPIDLENAILSALYRLKVSGGRGITLQDLHHRMTPVAAGISWRLVANATYRLERQGLVHIVGDELVRDVSLPTFGLSPAGELEAVRVASICPGVGLPTVWGDD